jgi:hypothetical protein
MTTAAIVFLICWAIVTGAARTPIALLLHRLMVEWPAAAINRLEPGHIALAIVVTILVVMHLNAGDSDPIRMVALFAPEVTVWLAGIEIGAIVEALIALTAAAATFRGAGFAARLKRIFVSLWRHPKDRVNRAPHARRLKRKMPANDDEDGGSKYPLDTREYSEIGGFEASGFRPPLISCG